MKIFGRFIFIVIFGVAFFLAAMPPRAFAQYTGDLNTHPTIIMDKRAIEIDRRILKAAKEEKDAGRIKAAKERLRHDIAKLKSDKVALRKRK